jgi:uncharacterized protein (TIGR02265 family)
MPGPQKEDRVVYQSAFDALARAVDLDHEPGLIEELRGLGYDRRAEVTEYPPKVLQAVLLRLVSHAFPALPMEVGCRELGRTAFQAYRSTLVGQVAMAAVSLLSVERALRLAVRSFRTVSNFSEHEVLPAKERELLYRVRHTILPPEYTQGLLEGLMVSTRNPHVVVTLTDRTTDPLEFRLTW